MYDDIAGLRFTLEADGFDRFETACGHDESSVRTFLLETDGIEEAFVLQTCQRYELYAHGPGARDHLASLGRTIGVDLDADDRLVVGNRAVDHLLRVACGLESGVLGEDEILGQLRGAYKRASEADALGGTLDTVVLKALRVGERARTETDINRGRVSLGSVTLDRARQELGAIDSVDSLSECTILVIGAGEVAELVVKALDHRLGGDSAEEPDAATDGSIVIANRTLETAERLADTVGGEAIQLEAIDSETLSATDVLVSATGADDRVLRIGDVVGHELVVFDLANPRDVDPAVDDLADVRLVSIDEVLAAKSNGIERRKAAIPEVEAIIDEELKRLRTQLRAERIDDSLGQIYAHAHGLRESEFDRAIDRLEAEGDPLSETQEAAIRDFSEALINKLLHPKTTALKQAAAADDRETVETWLQLFDDQFERSDRAESDDVEGPKDEAEPPATPRQ